MLESAISKAILKDLAMLGPRCLFWKVSASRYGKAGIADIIGTMDGRFMAFEVKTPEAYKKPNHNLSPSQILYLQKVRAAGGVGECVCSVEQVQEIVSRELQSP